MTFPHRPFCVFHYFHCRERVEGIPGYSEPFESNPARRNGILLPHVRLPSGATVFLISRSGMLIYDIFGGQSILLCSPRARLAINSALARNVSFLSPRRQRYLRTIDMDFPRTHTMFLPMMACRLMLSLRKAASEPSALWTLSHVSRGDRRISIGVNTESGLPVYGASLPKPNGEYVELGSMPQALRKSDLS